MINFFTFYDKIALNYKSTKLLNLIVTKQKVVIITENRFKIQFLKCYSRYKFKRR